MAAEFAVSEHSLVPMLRSGAKSRLRFVNAVAARDACLIPTMLRALDCPAATGMRISPAMRPGDPTVIGDAVTLCEQVPQPPIGERLRPFTTSRLRGSRALDAADQDRCRQLAWLHPHALSLPREQLATARTDSARLRASYSGTTWPPGPARLRIPSNARLANRRARSAGQPSGPPVARLSRGGGLRHRREWLPTDAPDLPRNATCRPLRTLRASLADAIVPGSLLPFRQSCKPT